MKTFVKQPAPERQFLWILCPQPALEHVVNFGIKPSSEGNRARQWDE